MAKVELKAPIVEEIAANIKDAQSVVLVDHRGLTVEQDTRLRKNLREAGVTYKVYKNTFMTRAFKGTECEGLKDPVQVQSLPRMQPLLQEFLQNLRRLPINWRLRQVLWKAPCMMPRELLLLQAFLPEKCLFPDCLAVCRALSPILPVS